MTSSKERPMKWSGREGTEKEIGCCTFTEITCEDKEFQCKQKSILCTEKHRQRMPVSPAQELTKTALKTVELMPSATSNSPFSLGLVKLLSRPEPNILKTNK